MKNFLFTFLALFPFICQAQNYNCIQSGQAQYFTNSTHYLRCISIDSSRVSATDTTFYPYKTYFPMCTTCSAGSWISSRVVKKNDGAFLFRTYREDTIIIRPQALPGDSWVFYNDTSTKYYMASVVSVDTMTFAGILDSVKRIRINAFISGTPYPSDSCDNLEFYLSKDHGFVRIFSVFFFPDVFTNIDPLQVPGGKGMFSRVQYHNPTKLEVLQYSPGDIIQSYSTSNPYPYNESDYVYYDSVVARDSLDPYHIQYTLFRWSSWSSIVATYGSSYTDHGYSTYLYYLMADTSLLMPRTLPESRLGYKYPLCFHYNPNDTAWCITSPFYSFDYYISFEGCPYGSSFKSGIGQTYYENTHFWAGDIGFCVGESSSIGGTIINGIRCYNPVKPTYVGVEDVYGLNNFAVSPNPSDGVFTITAPSNITSIAVYDLLGKIVYTGDYNTKQVQIDLSTLPQGMYLLKANGIEVRKIIKL